jgi:hypothetical protein
MQRISWGGDAGAYAASAILSLLHQDRTHHFRSGNKGISFAA